MAPSWWALGACAAAWAASAPRGVAGWPTQPPLPRVSLRPKEDGSGDRVFVDSSGRERVFQGTAVVVKGPPWLPRLDRFDPLTSLVERDFDVLLDAGINLLRLGVMWPGAEPVRGQYNETYFTLVRQIVDMAGKRGLYVLLDMHQDGLSEYFCGEGVPSWAVEQPERSWLRFPVPLWATPVRPGPDGFPSRQDCELIVHNNIIHQGWEFLVSAIAPGHAYESLYRNTNNLTEAWGAFWAKTASAVKGLDNVLGFELVNEPFVGDPWADPTVLVPGEADRRRLQPAYDTLVRHIRAVDGDSLVFFPGITWDDNTPVGFTRAPGGEQEAHRSVLAYHYYLPPQGKDFPAYMRVRMEDARRLGTGLMMTESNNHPLFDAAAPALAAAGQSWIHWEWKKWCREDNASVASPFQAAAWGACKTGGGWSPWSDGATSPNPKDMARFDIPYLPAVAGVLQGTAWNRSAGVFTAVFRPDPSIGGPTEVLLTPVGFPHGCDVEVEPAVLAVEHRPELARVLLTPLANATKDLPVTVRIVRRAPTADEALVVV